MNGRELFEAIYAGEKTDRLPISGVGPWAETLTRWRTEGLGAADDPNAILGLTGRLGSIQKGRDADLVILDGDPLEPSSRIEMVLIDGKIVYQRKQK